MEEIQVGKEYAWFGQTVKVLEIHEDGLTAKVETRFGAWATAELCDLGEWR
jgi:hypothetical protein